MLEIKKIPWRIVSTIATIFALFGANTMCWWIAHEVEMPEEIKRLRKL